MAVEYKSLEYQAWQENSSGLINLPSGTSVGDLLLFHLSDAQNNLTVPPSGFIHILSKKNPDPSYYLTVHLYWKIATASDISTGNVTFDFSGTTKYSAGLTRLSGVDPVNPISVYNSDGATGSPNTVHSFAGMTPGTSNLLMAFSMAKTSGTYTTCTIATNNPGFTLATTANTVLGYTRAMWYSAVRPAATATGLVTITSGSSFDHTTSAIIAINPDLISNLVSYWKLDESSGNAADSVGSNTAINESITYSTGKLNNGAVFNSTSDRFSLGDPANLKLSGAHSLSSWINLGGISRSSLDQIFYKGNDGVDFSCISLYWSGTNTLVYRINPDRSSNSTWKEATGSITVDSNWHLISATYDGSIMRLYWDGVQIGSTSTNVSIDTTGNWYLGNTNSTRSINKTLDEMAIWSRALTTSEVSQIYNFGMGLQYPFTRLPGAISVLVLAGGGGGGSNRGGGGGSGGFIYNPSFPVSLSSYLVTVGTGGAGGSSGQDSVFSSLTAIRGGRGGSISNVLASSRGGGAGSNPDTWTINNGAGQGYTGGSNLSGDNPRNTGGGGGFSSAGLGGAIAPNGGSGILNYISGSAVMYAAGGGGGDPGWDRVSYGKGIGGSGVGGNGGGKTSGDKNATSATGYGSGGGGGGMVSEAEIGTAGAGSPGVVIIRYTTADFGVVTGGIKTVVGSDTIHTFTTAQSGTYLVLNAVLSVSVSDTINIREYVTRNYTLPEAVTSYYKFDEATGNAIDTVGGRTAINTSVTYETCKINNGARFKSTYAGLVSFYKLDEVSGNATDSIGSNTLTNTSVTYEAGKLNNGARFKSTFSWLTHYYKFDETSGNATDSIGTSHLVNTNVNYAAAKINNGAVFTPAAGSPSTLVQALVVAGGGGTSGVVNSGGAGAGGLLYNTAFNVGLTSYSVTVGNGGVGLGQNGQNSVFSTLTAIGGGYGGSGNQVGAAGGCGGGGGSQGGTYAGGVGSQGFNGGGGASWYGGGGGGMGGAGPTAPRVAPFYGIGLSNSISGSAVTYCAGGSSGSMVGGSNGTPNTGNGANAEQTVVHTGGSGIVIIRYPTANFGNCTGGVKTTVGSDTVHTFLTSGTMTFVAPSSSYFTAPDSVIPIGMKTVSFWLKATSTSDWQTVLGTMKWDMDGQYGLSSWIDKDNGLIVFSIRKDTVIASVTSTFDITDNVMRLFTLTWDGTTNNNSFKLYVNGVLNNEGTSSSLETDTQSHNLLVGANDPLSTRYYLNGTIDELGIWNRDLQPDEVLDLYNSNAGKALAPTSKLESGVTMGISGSATRAVSFWFKLNKLNFRPWISLVGWIGATEANYKYFDIEIDGTNLCVHYYGNDLDIATVASLGTSNWHHVVFQYNGTKVEAYLDGVLVVDQVVPTLETTGFFTMGTRPAHNNTFDGLIDEVGVWNRTLSQYEVLDLYNSNAAKALSLPSYFLAPASLPLSPFSVSFWIKPKVPSYLPYIMVLVFSNGSQVLRFFMGTDGRFEVDQMAGEIGNTYITTIQFDVWQLLTVTWDGSVTTIYKNGVFGASTLAPYTFSTMTSLDIGGSGAYMSADLDELGIWNRVLTPTEVSTLYNGNQGLQYPFILPVFSISVSDTINISNPVILSNLIPQRVVSSPGTVTNDTSVGTVAWINPENAKIHDEIYSNATFATTATSNYLKATNFGFNIPIGAAILGVMVEIDRRLFSIDDYIADNRISLVKSDGIIGSTIKSIPGRWGAIQDAYYQYGSVSDSWGEVWTSDDINNTNFGVVLAVDGQLSDTLFSSSARVDHMRITIYYQTADRYVSVSNNITIGDALSVERPYTEFSPEITENISLSESVNVEEALPPINTLDTIQISEEVSVLRHTYQMISVSDSIHMSETNSVTNPIPPVNKTDNVIITENLHLERFFNINCSDVIRSTESLILETYKFSVGRAPVGRKGRTL